MEKFITLTEAAKILGIEESEIIKLAEKGEITTYRIGGNFLRFKLSNIEDYKRKISSLPQKESKETVSYSLKDKIYDFFYYYDFYIIIILLIILLLIIVLKF